MKKLHILGAAAVAAGALALNAAPASAYYHGHHHYHGHYHGGDVGLGIVGGLAAGALVGAAVANSYDDDDCYYVKQRVYVPHVGWRIRDVEHCD